jgi:hypothetical protein
MNPWFLIGVFFAISTAGGVGYYKGHQDGKAYVQQQWDKERAEQQAAYAKAQAEAREKEQLLQQQADTLRKEKDVEIQNLTAHAASLSNSLRDRQSRATKASAMSSTANAGCPTVICSGAELPREDAEFLAREAARADQARILLKQCYDQYQTIKAK